MWEAEDVGRVGIEWDYTGRQSLEENPYRTLSEPYMILGLLAEKQFGRVRLFVNGENLTGVRQTRWDPLLRPTRAVDGRWTVDAWAPSKAATSTEASASDSESPWPRKSGAGDLQCPSDGVEEARFQPLHRIYLSKERLSWNR